MFKQYLNLPHAKTITKMHCINFNNYKLSIYSKKNTGQQHLGFNFCTLFSKTYYEKQDLFKKVNKTF